MTHLRGKFIVLDGGEGCGKSTQIGLLRQALSAAGLRVCTVRDPGTTRLGEKIRALLLDPDHTDMSMRCEMLLYMAARAQMSAEIIQPALRAGQVVLSDRFVSSTLAYQLGGDGLTAGEIRTVADTALAGRWPDLTLVLDMPLERSAARVREKFVAESHPAASTAAHAPRKDRIEQRPADYHQNVRQNFLDQARDDPRHYRVILAEGDVHEVHQRILQTLRTWGPDSAALGPS